MDATADATDAIEALLTTTRTWAVVGASLVDIVVARGNRASFLLVVRALAELA